MSWTHQQDGTCLEVVYFLTMMRTYLFNTFVACIYCRIIHCMNLFNLIIINTPSMYKTTLLLVLPWLGLGIFNKTDLTQGGLL